MSQKNTLISLLCFFDKFLKFLHCVCSFRLKPIWELSHLLISVRGSLLPNQNVIWSLILIRQLGIHSFGLSWVAPLSRWLSFNQRWRIFGHIIEEPDFVCLIYNRHWVTFVTRCDTGAFWHFLELVVRLGAYLSVIDKVSVLFHDLLALATACDDDFVGHHIACTSAMARTLVKSWLWFMIFLHYLAKLQTSLTWCQIVQPRFGRIFVVTRACRYIHDILST